MRTNEEIRKDIDELIEQLKLKKCNSYHGFLGFVRLSHEAAENGIPTNHKGLQAIPPSEELIKLLLNLRSQCHSSQTIAAGTNTA
jgi:hypothetical protein